MQNNNKYTVERLVTKYRNFVKENTQKVMNCHTNGEFAMSESSVDSKSDEQLLVIVYKSVAGENANNKILEALSEYEQHFYKDALDTKEIDFLCENFAEFVEYEFAHRKQWSGQQDYNFYKENNNIKDIIRERIVVHEGMTVFITNSRYCDLATLFKGCIVRGFTSSQINDSNNNWIKANQEVWALGQIRLYALGIQSEIEPSFNLDFGKETADLIVSDFCNYIFSEHCNDIYSLLKNDGHMYIFTTRNELVDYNKYDQFICKESGKNHAYRELQFRAFLKKLVEDKAICSLISYQDEESSLGWPNDCVLINAQKKFHPSVLVESLYQGISTVVDSSILESDFLWPGYYLANRPKEGIPLSSLVKLFNVQNEVAEQSQKRKKSNLELSKSLKVLLPKESGSEFAESILNEEDMKELSDSMYEGWESRFICLNQPGVCLYGNSKKIVLGFINENPSEKYVCVDIVPYLVPQKDVDVRYIAALLLSPAIKQQIMTVFDGPITSRPMSLILDKIIVPNHTPKERIQFLADVSFDALRSNQEKLKKNHNDYKIAVRRRKHSLTQSLSSIEAMFYALNACRERQGGKLSDENVISRRKNTTVQDAFKFIEPKLKNMMYTLERIADVEYSFDDPEWIDPEQFIENYVNHGEGGWMTFKPIITWAKGHNRHSRDLFEPETHEIIAKKGDAINMLYFSQQALKLILDNIVANAIAHGFTDSSRDDYQLRFSWHTEGTNLVIEIDNNGNPIPADRDTASLLEYGVSGSLHQDGHNGIGCNEIDDIMHRYDGKVEIVSTPDKDFTVKYVLVFKSNIILSI